MDKWYNSSANPNALSTTIQSLLIGWIPVIILIAQLADIPVSEELLTEIVQWVSLVVAGIMFLFGIGRKIYYWSKKWYNSL